VKATIEWLVHRNQAFIDGEYADLQGDDSLDCVSATTGGILTQRAKCNYGAAPYQDSYLPEKGRFYSLLTQQIAPNNKFHDLVATAVYF